jgi:hypothetical protein
VTPDPKVYVTHSLLACCAREFAGVCVFSGGRRSLLLGGFLFLSPFFSQSGRSFLGYCSLVGVLSRLVGLAVHLCDLRGFV